MDSMSHKKAIAITCFVALMWSLAGFNIKMIEWSPYAIAAGRSLVAVILLAPMVLRKGFQKIDRYVIGGAICYAAFNYCFITSTTLTSSAIAIMMQYTAPIYVALLSWLFLRERVGWADIISVGFVFLGMIFFFLDSNSGGSLKGNIVSIFNGITFAGISIFLRLQKDGNPALSMYLGNVISAVAGLPIMWNAGMPDTISLLFLLLAGLLVAVSYTLYAKASTGLSALETVLIPIIDPVMNPVWVFLFLDERPGALTIVGAAVILVSVTIRVVSGLTPSSASRTRG
ncbi:DMT family transporter [Lawsonibacter asaccharolyticus]|jgi:hypothetical protein